MREVSAGFGLDLLASEAGSNCRTSPVGRGVENKPLLRVDAVAAEVAPRMGLTDIDCLVGKPKMSICSLFPTTSNQREIQVCCPFAV
jgi:hypothetical protein